MRTWRVPVTRPYSVCVSYVTVMVKVSPCSPTFRSLGTRHKYREDPSQPKPTVSSATTLPEESVTTNFGSIKGGLGAALAPSVSSSSPR